MKSEDICVAMNVECQEQAVIYRRVVKPNPQQARSLTPPLDQAVGISRRDWFFSYIKVVYVTRLFRHISLDMDGIL